MASDTYSRRFSGGERDAASSGDVESTASKICLKGGIDLVVTVRGSNVEELQFCSGLREW